MQHISSIVLHIDNRAAGRVNLNMRSTNMVNGPTDSVNLNISLTPVEASVLPICDTPVAVLYC